MNIISITITATYDTAADDYKELSKLGDQLTHLVDEADSSTYSITIDKDSEIIRVQESQFPTDFPTLHFVTHFIAITINNNPAMLVGGWLLKKISDDCWDWMKARRKRVKAHQIIQIYGPNGEVIKTITMSPSKED